MRRRTFISLLGGAATWSLAAHAQQSAMPAVGFLAPLSIDEEQLRGFRQGLKQAGFVEGENVSVLYRSAENEMDRLPALADDLARRGVAVIAATTAPAAFAAKAATATVRVSLAAAKTLGLELNVINASIERDLDAAFAKLTELRASGLTIGGATLFTSHIEQLAALTVRRRIPAVYQRREFAAAGRRAGTVGQCWKCYLPTKGALALAGQTNSAFLLVVRTPAGLTNPISPRTDRRADSLVRIDFGNKGALSIRSRAHS